MTEKRPTPDESAGKAAARRKRAAPTIDLTATEVPTPVSPVVTSEADPPPPPHAADAPDAEPAPQPEPSSAPPRNHAINERKSVRSFLTVPVLAAGLTGAAAMSIVLLTMWLTGLLPIRFAGLTMTRARVTALEMQLQDLQKRQVPNAENGAADTKTIDVLTQRVAKMEESLAKIPSADPALAERMTAADNAMKALGVTQTALNRRNDDIAATSTQARERAEAAEKAIADLRGNVQDVSKTANAGASSADLAPLQQRIATLEQTARTASAEIAKASASDTAARRALSAALLRDSVLRGAPFTAELAQAKALGADSSSIGKLEEFAATGLPTRAVLAKELQPMISGLRDIFAPAASGGFVERLQAHAGQLVRIRPVDAPPGDDTMAVLARLESAAARADIPSAIVELGKLRRPELTDYERSPQAFWIIKAQKREAAAAAVQAYAAETASSLGSK
jgi:hypothetical protein